MGHDLDFVHPDEDLEKLAEAFAKAVPETRVKALAAALAVLAGKPVPASSGVPRKFTVSLKHNKPHVVEAFDEAGAVDKYKRFLGIRESIHPFEVVDAPDDAKAEA